MRKRSRRFAHMRGNRQKTEQLTFAFLGSQGKEKPLEPERRGEPHKTKESSETQVFGKKLMEEICERENLKKAYKRVTSNKGSPGCDGMKTEELRDYLKEYWPQLREQLENGTYQPQAVRRVEIPKPNGGVRQLGIPTVVDRFIQQAVTQVLSKIWEPSFCENSYGFRPGRSAHQAIAKAQSFIQAGFGYVVDLDLEKFFDRVNHDRLMGRVAKKVRDSRVLKLLRRYLTAGVMTGGVVSPREKGTPQGGPISPLLSNILLDDLDKELERRGHHFCRYADDCNIYVRSERAGKRVMESITNYLAKRLQLQVNREKSGVARTSQRSFLGFSFTAGTKTARRRVSKEALQRLKQRIRKLTRRSQGKNWGQVLQEVKRYLRGWRGYFGFSETTKVLRDLDSWIRRRLRNLLWSQWKTKRKRRKELRKRGVSDDLARRAAYCNRGPWRMSRTEALCRALPNRYFDSLELPRLAEKKTPPSSNRRVRTRMHGGVGGAGL